MATIQHVHRRGAVYWWRRRLPFLDPSRPHLRIEISLRTRSPGKARRLAAALTLASEQLREGNAARMLSPQEARLILAAVARRHAAKLDAVAADEVARGLAATGSRQLDLAMGWAMRILSVGGNDAASRDAMTEAMRQAGLDRVTISDAWDFAETYREIPPISDHKLETLLHEHSIAPTSVNLAQARQLALRGMAIALLDVERRWSGRRPEDGALMERIFMDEALASEPAPRHPADGQSPVATARPPAPVPAKADAAPIPAEAYAAPAPAEADAAPAAAGSSPAPRVKSLSILAVADQLAEEKMKQREWTAKTARQVRSTAGLFVRMLGHDDKPKFRLGNRKVHVGVIMPSHAESRRQGKLNEPRRW